MLGVHRILHELFGHDEGPERSEGVVVLADEPIGAAHLAVATAAAIGHVDLHRVAEDVVGRAGDRHVLRGLADDHVELALEVDVGASARHHDVVERAGDDGRRLLEQIRVVARIAGRPLPDARSAHGLRRGFRRGAGALLLGGDARRVLHVVAAGVQHDHRLHGRQHLQRIERVGVSGHRPGGGDVPGNGSQPSFPVGVVTRDELLHVARRRQLRRRGVRRLEGGVGRPDLDHLRVLQHEAHKRRAAPRERAELERHRGAAALGVRARTTPGTGTRQCHRHGRCSESGCRHVLSPMSNGPTALRALRILWRRPGNCHSRGARRLGPDAADRLPPCEFTHQTGPNRRRASARVRRARPGIPM